MVQLNRRWAPHRSQDNPSNISFPPLTLPLYIHFLSILPIYPHIPLPHISSSPNCHSLSTLPLYENETLYEHRKPRKQQKQSGNLPLGHPVLWAPDKNGSKNQEKWGPWTNLRASIGNKIGQKHLCLLMLTGMARLNRWQFPQPAVA